MHSTMEHSITDNSNVVNHVRHLRTFIPYTTETLSTATLLKSLVFEFAFIRDSIWSYRAITPLAYKLARPSNYYTACLSGAFSSRIFCSEELLFRNNFLWGFLPGIFPPMSVFFHWLRLTCLFTWLKAVNYSQLKLFQHEDTNVFRKNPTITLTIIQILSICKTTTLVHILILFTSYIHTLYLISNLQSSSNELVSSSNIVFIYILIYLDYLL
jgi:hypothetical protein